MKYLLIILIALLVVPELKAQQDPKFNQYMFNPLGVNPGYAGSRDVLSAVLLYRNQWVGIDGAPETQTLAIHTPIKRRKLGVGLEVMNDRIGPKGVTSVAGSYSYRLRLPRGRLALGLRAGVLNHRFDWDMVEYRQTTDVYAQQGRESFITPNFDFGAYYYTRKLYAGLEVAHLNNPRVNLIDTTSNNYETRIDPQLTVIAGKAFVINEEFVFRPSILYKQAGIAPGFLDINANILFNKVLWLGVGVRPTYGALFIAEYSSKKGFRFGYSYDFAFNQLQSRSGGSHEIFLGYEIKLSRSRMLSPRYF